MVETLHPSAPAGATTPVPAPDGAARDPERGSTGSVADSRGLAWALLALLLVAFVWQAAPRVGALFGDSHDGTNAAVWGSASRAIREDGFVASRGGARLADLDYVYAHHPPLIASEVALAETLLGEHPWSTRAPAWLGSIASVLLLYAVLRAHRLARVPSALGAVVALGSPMFFLYGTMLDTTMVGLPFTLAFLLAHRRAADDRRWVSLVVGFGLLAGLASWEGLLCCGVVAALDVVAVARGSAPRRMPPSLLALGAAGALTLAWLWWSAGSLGPIVDQLSERSATTAVDRSPTGWRDFLDFQWLYLAALLSPLVLLLAVPATVCAWADLRTRRLFVTLAAVTVVYPVALREGALNHDYWNYWLTLPSAVGIAALAARVFDSDRTPAAAGRVAAAIVVAVTVLAIACAVPTGVAARAAYDTGRAASAPLDAAAASLAPGARLRVAGHNLDDRTAWITYRIRRRPVALVGAGAAAQLAARAPTTPVLVKCPRAPEWLAPRCAGAPAPYMIVPVGALVGG